MPTVKTVEANFTFVYVDKRRKIGLLAAPITEYLASIVI